MRALRVVCVIVALLFAREAIAANIMQGGWSRHRAKRVPKVKRAPFTAPGLTGLRGLTTVEGVELQLNPDTQTVAVGETVSLHTVIVNGGPAATVQARVVAEYTGPSGARVSQTAVSSIVITSTLTEAYLRIYPPAGCEYRVGTNTFAVGSVVGEEAPVTEVVRADDLGVVHLFWARPRLVAGEVISIRYTVTVVGLDVAPDGRIVTAAAVTLLGPPPVPIF